MRMLVTAFFAPLQFLVEKRKPATQTALAKCVLTKFEKNLKNVYRSNQKVKQIYIFFWYFVKKLYQFLLYIFFIRANSFEEFFIRAKVTISMKLWNAKIGFGWEKPLLFCRRKSVKRSKKN